MTVLCSAVILRFDFQHLSLCLEIWDKHAKFFQRLLVQLRDEARFVLFTKFFTKLGVEKTSDEAGI